MMDKDTLPIVIRGPDPPLPESSPDYCWLSPLLCFMSAHAITNHVGFVSAEVWPRLWCLPVADLAKGYRTCLTGAQPHSSTEGWTWPYLLAPFWDWDHRSPLDNHRHKTPFVSRGLWSSALPGWCVWTLPRLGWTVLSFRYLTPNEQAFWTTWGTFVARGPGEQVHAVALLSWISSVHSGDKSPDQWPGPWVGLPQPQVWFLFLGWQEEELNSGKAWGTTGRGQISRELLACHLWEYIFIFLVSPKPIMLKSLYMWAPVFTANVLHCGIGWGITYLCKTSALSTWGTIGGMRTHPWVGHIKH